MTQKGPLKEDVAAEFLLKGLRAGEVGIPAGASLSLSGLSL
jgi:hypothetical protein